MLLTDPDQFGIEWGWDFEKDEIDPDATYVSETRSSMFWRFDGDAKLIGEEVFNRKPDTVRKANDDDIIMTKEKRTEITKQYWPEEIKAELEAET
ncbi:hypothetical protein [Halocatena salina]|uniref:Uncharacterized protein n=1 Tax=Halocatena salina TaxID=2934340 RepID=A0A8U0ABT3_9EURY|nr:hypothetical protein [Halocatena salina]UPM45217.1 hypothetical protein MW046_17870 [Halocatena salina]